MKAHIRRVWWAPSCSYVWQIEVPCSSGDTVEIQRYDWREFIPAVDGEMAGLYEAVASLKAH